MKKKILIIAIAVILIGAIIATAILVPKLEYAKDSTDTEELFRQNVASVNYENTIETAIPQTELYNIVKEHFESELPEGKTEKKAIIIGYDGCRADVLKEMRDEKSAISTMLHDGASLNLAYCGGVNYPAENTQDTSTAPGWCSILTGVWADEHGITANDITKTLEHKTLLTSLVEDKVIDSSSFITRWKGHFDRNNATYNEEKKYCEDNNLNVSFNRLKNDEASHEYTLSEVNKNDCADFIFVIYEPTDSTGHNYGFTINNPRYKEAFRTADLYGLETIDAIKSRETYDSEDWLIIITSDHGGIETNHGDASIQERMTFIVSNKNLTDNKTEETTDVTEPSAKPETTTFKEESTTKKPYVQPIKPAESTTNDLPAYVHEIKILNLPHVTTYYVGDKFSADGLKVQAYFHNGTSADVTDAVSFANNLDAVMSTPGVKRINVEYVDFDTNLVTTSFTITVKEPPATEPTESTEPIEATEPIETTDNAEYSETL